MNHLKNYLLLVVCLSYSLLYARDTISFKVLDSETQKGLESALFSYQGGFVHSDEKGVITLSSKCQQGWVKAAGYRQIEIEKLQDGDIVALEPFTPRGVYLSLYGIDNRQIRQDIMDMVGMGQLNTLVIDVKNGEGLVSVPVDNPIALMSGAQRVITIRSPEKLLKNLKEEGIYTIARVAVFKDDKLARLMPEWAVKNGDKSFKDRQNMGWTDPFIKDVREYNIDIAVTAARMGFDEIQFDYVRFPDRTNLSFAEEANETTRTDAISGFLAEAYEKVSGYGSYVSADVFGYSLWRKSDIGLGQRLEALSGVVDYLSPMLYPSGFEHGIPSYPNPMESVYEVIYNSLDMARERTGLPARHFRPWLQAFRDYAFDRRFFKTKLVSEQILATEHFGSHGWLLWNPRNRYSAIFPLEDRLVYMMQESDAVTD